MKQIKLLLFGIIILILIGNINAYNINIPYDISNEKMTFNINGYYFENDLNTIKLNYKDGNNILTADSKVKVSKDVSNKDSNYINILQETDIKYEQLDNELKETIILKKKPNLNYDKEIEISSNLKFDERLEVFADGIIQKGDFETYGNIQFRDKTMTRFTFPSPYAIDSKGNRIDLKYRFYTTNFLFWKTPHFSVVIPSNYLINAVYPVEIDPSAVAGCTETTNDIICADGTFIGNYIDTTKNISINNSNINGNSTGAGFSGYLRLNTSGWITITNSTLNSYGNAGDVSSKTGGTGELYLISGDYIIFNGTINSYGGRGGTGVSVGDGGQGGTALLNITALNYINLSSGTINSYGGDGGNANCGASNCDGGAGGYSNININSSTVQINTIMNTYGGAGGSRYNFGNAGGGGNSYFNLDSNIFNITKNINAYGGSATGASASCRAGGAGRFNLTSNIGYIFSTINNNQGSDAGGTCTTLDSSSNIRISSYLILSNLTTINSLSDNQDNNVYNFYDGAFGLQQSIIPYRINVYNTGNLPVSGYNSSKQNVTFFNTYTNYTSLVSSAFNSPIDNYNSILNEVIFNVSSVSIGSTLSNITLYIWGEADHINTTLISGTSNNTIFNYTLGIGEYDWNVYTCDNIANCFWANNYTLIVGFSNSQNYNLNTYETSNEQFIINITYNRDNYPVSTANLIYNGTSYISTKSTSGLNTLFTSNVLIPLSTADKINNSFYWSVSLTNTTGTFNFNTSLTNQTVNQIFLGDCGGTNTTLALNITAYNEKTLNRINPFSIGSTLNYSIGSSDLSKIYSFGNTSISEKNICISVNTTYTLNGLISYSNDSFQPSTFYFLNQEVSNLTNHFALYLLPSTSSTSFILQVQDQNILPLAQYTIKVNRYYPAYNTYQTVQVVKTDENGQSIAFLETETVDYQFLIYDTDGNLVYTSDKRKIIPQSTPYTITFTVGSLLPSPLSYLENLTGLNYGLTYDKSTMKVTFTYADSNSSFTSSRLIVSKLNMSGNDNILCNSSLTTPDGVIVCDLTGNLSGTYSAKIYITRDEVNFINNLVFEINTFADTSGMLGVMGGFFILLIVAFLFPYSPLASIITMDAGIIFLQLIGFINFGAVAITAIIAISIIIAIVLERD